MLSKHVSTRDRICVKCNTKNGKDLEFINAKIARLSNSKSHTILQGVLHCKNCKSYFIDKATFANVIKENNYDVWLAREEITVNEDMKIQYDTWFGAKDTVLSRFGYKADWLQRQFRGRGRISVRSFKKR